MATNKNIISLSPEKAVSYCEIVLSELALKASDENTIISSTYIHFGFSGVSMPVIRFRELVDLEIFPPLRPIIIIDSPFSFEQLEFIEGLFKNNRDASMFRFAKLLHHYRRKISRCLNSKRLDSAQQRWLNDPENVDRDVKFSPRCIAEDRLHKWSRKASHKSLPGLSDQSYSDYLENVFSRLA
ncbi:hypothetical protein [Methylosarcina fibrata]|jgi:hypothetical protein|uniref:hypothetical protein n=1 Tax=Methylosarcina fibrata TaxID=105972 RepID=UPI0012FC4CDC|nr:hypothetical protein [Methylosarcina fibrata]